MAETNKPKRTPRKKPTGINRKQTSASTKLRKMTAKEKQALKRSLLPQNNMRRKTVTARHLAVLMAIREGSDPRTSLESVGYTLRHEYQIDVILGAIVRRLERFLQLSDLFALMGLSDFDLTSKLIDLTNSDNSQVRLGALKLAFQLKGHLTKKDDTDQRPSPTFVFHLNTDTGDQGEVTEKHVKTTAHPFLIDTQPS